MRDHRRPPGSASSGRGRVAPAGGAERTGGPGYGRERGSGSLSQAELLGPTEIRALAARLGLQPSKRLGQNFVVDAGTVSRITAMAGLHPDDVVLEVGPGFGSLTLPLLAAARRVIAIEVDRALAAELLVTVARAGAAAGGPP